MGEQEERLSGICAQIAGRRLPGWTQLPDFDLYMDQVIALAGRSLGEEGAGGDRQLTSSMVNNYVKMGAMPPPVKKRYARTHIAHLIVICVLKPVMPIADICGIIKGELARMPEAEFYDGFCRAYAACAAAGGAAGTAEAPDDGGDLRQTALRAALRAQAEQALAVRLLEAAQGAEA